MKILGIETSCDETACAVVEDGERVLSNVIFSQVDMHAKTGGVVPEVAAREHILKIIPVIDEALKKASCDWDDIDALAVTQGPGLVSSLIIGTETVSVISHLKDKPVIPVHHIVGHVYANFLRDGQDDWAGNAGETVDRPQFPVLILTVSGGHNEIILMRGHGDFTILGETRDDAAGEAFDKVARILGLGYPGGPVVAKAATKGDREKFKLPRSYLEEGSLDFSFSGLKTAVLNEVKEYLKREHPDSEFGDYSEISKNLPEQFKADLSASFQEAVVDVLTDKLIQAFLNLQEEGSDVKEIHLAGGVSANTRLREVLTHKINELIKNKHMKKTEVRWPENISYCTDNAAMIAGAGYYLWKSGGRSGGRSAGSSAKKSANITPTTNFDLF